MLVTRGMGVGISLMCFEMGCPSESSAAPPVAPPAVEASIDGGVGGPLDPYYSHPEREGPPPDGRWWSYVAAADRALFNTSWLHQGESQVLVVIRGCRSAGRTMLETWRAEAGRVRGQNATLSCRDGGRLSETWENEDE